MLYTLLGKTGRKVSRIGFGGVPAGVKNYVEAYDPGRKDDYTEGVKAVQRAYELGVNYFDTAPGYGNGMSENIIGKALEGVPASQLFLATKFRYAEDPDLFHSLEGSLKRLKRDSVDLLQIHGDHYSPEMNEILLKKDGILAKMVKAKEQGLVRYLGFTGECQNPCFYQLIETEAFEVMQVQYNLLFQHPYDPFFKSGSMYECKKRNMGIVTMRSLTSGIFQKWMKIIRPEDDFDYSAALIQYVLSNPFVDTALLGMRSVEQVEWNVRTCMDLEHRIDLEKLHQRKVD